EIVPGIGLRRLIEAALGLEIHRQPLERVARGGGGGLELAQETRRERDRRPAEAAPARGVRDVELLLRARDAHEEKPPLLLEVDRVGVRANERQDPVLAPEDEHIRKLE